MPEKEPKTSSTDDVLEVIEVSAVVVMRIVKHCSENLPDAVNGILVGLDESSKLFVTDCFGLKTSDEDEGGEGNAQYQSEMLRCLRDVNVDCNTIGWYQSTYMGSFLNEQLVDNQFTMQTDLPKSVVIVYDPLQLSEGKAFRAFRLKSAFMKKYAENKKAERTQTGQMQTLVSSEIFQEVPMRVQTSVLVEAFLLDQSKLFQASQFAALDLENQAYLEKNITFILDSLDLLSAEQQKMQYYERLAVRQAQQQKTFTEKRRQENVARRERGEELLPEQEGPAFKRTAMPSQIDTLLLSNQIQTYCSQIQSFAGDSFGKVYLVGGVNSAA